MKLRMLLLLSLAIAFVAFSAAPNALALTWTETIDGDLSDAHGAPTFLALDPGVNTVSGTMGTPPGGPLDADIFTFTIGAGEALVGFDLTALVPSSPLGTGSFLALSSGTSISSSNPSLHLGAALIPGPADLLTSLGTTFGGSGFTSPLGPGDYTFWIQETATT
ncbi:MAG: hypothetical protein AAGC67_21180, partial [Myxococcota bacterium]